MECDAVRILEDGGEDGPQQEGASPPEGRVDAARVAHVKVQEFHSAVGNNSFFSTVFGNIRPLFTSPARVLEGPVHVPQVLAVDEGEGGAVRQPLGEVLSHVVRRRDGLVQDQRRVLGRTDILHLK